MVFYRVILVLLVAGGLLSGCTVYDNIFHPHRLGTPAMSPEAKAKARATEKARHKGLTLPTPGADDTAEGSDAAKTDATAPAAADKTKSYSELPAGTRATYDKQGLLKKSPLVRMQQNKRKLHHYDLSAPKHTVATRDERRMRKHPKGGKGKAAPEPKAPREPREPAGPEPTPDPTQPATPKATKVVKTAAPKATKNAAPKATRAAPKPEPVRAEPPAKAPKPAKEKPVKEKPAKEKKDKKAPKAPKPDPTQPLNGDQ